VLCDCTSRTPTSSRATSSSAHRDWRTWPTRTCPVHGRPGARRPNAHPVSRLRVQVTDPSTARNEPCARRAGARHGPRDVPVTGGRPARPLRHPSRRASVPVRHRTPRDAGRAPGAGWRALGIDAASRESFGVAGINQNTWLAGLNRLLLGVAMSERELTYVSSVLPLDMVDSSDLDLVGAVAEIVAVVAGRRLVRHACNTSSLVTRFRELLDHLVAVSNDDAGSSGTPTCCSPTSSRRPATTRRRVGLGDMRHLGHGLAGRASSALHAPHWQPHGDHARDAATRTASGGLPRGPR